MKKNLFGLKNENINTNDYSFTSLLPEIPFYGLTGTICRIEVSKNSDGKMKCYHKVVYDHDGTIKPTKFSVPSCKEKNLELLLNDYYNDLKRYLDLNHDKYLDYKHDRLKNGVDKKKIKIAIFISAILSVINIPVLLSTVFVGAILEAICLFALYVSSDWYKKVVDDEKKCQFIKKYDEYQKGLVDHNLTKSNNERKNNRTIYTEISAKNQDLENSFSKVKTKILIKDDIKEAA